jgi:hypothetical protein
MTPDPVRIARLRALSLLTELIEQNADPEVPIVVSATVDGIAITVQVERVKTNVLTSGRLTEAEQAIVDALLGQALGRTADWIAVKLGRENDGALRARLSTLLRFGILTHDDSGYSAS